MMKIITKTVFTVSLLALLMSVPAFAASVNKSIKVGPGEESDGASSVNGSITVGDNAIVSGNVKTVNGSIRVAVGVSLENASTVNGSVKIGGNSETRHLSTVNGAVRIGESVTVDGEIETVNGKISLDSGSTVAEGVSNVNGVIELSGSEVAGDVSTVTGDITLQNQATVRGDIVVEKPSGWGWRKNDKRKPRLVIGPGSSVEGLIRLEREVDLFISETAKIGGIEGVMNLDDAIRFSGETP